MKILILIPLAILCMAALLSALGLGTSWNPQSDGQLSGITSTSIDGWFDTDAHLVCYANMTTAGEPGALHIRATTGNTSWAQITPAFTPSLTDEPWAYWVNASGSYSVMRGETVDYIRSLNVGFDLTNSYIFLGIVVAVMALGFVVGIHVLGSGTSETGTKTIVIGTLFLTLWAVLSAMSITLLTSIPTAGYIIYFVLTLMYTVGMATQISGGDGL